MSQNKPPGPDGWPLLGNTVQYVRRPFEFREECAEKYGDVVYMEGPGQEMYMLSHPEYVEQVLVTDHDAFTQPDDFQRRLERLLGNGLLVSEGEFWKRQRRLMQPMFKPGRIRAYADVMVEFAERKGRQWTPGETYDLNEEMKRLTLEVLLQAMFSTDIEYEETGVGSAVADIVEKFDPRAQMVPEWVPTPTNVRYKRGVRNLESLIYEMVEQRRSDDRERDDLLSRLLHAETDEGVSMSDEALRDEMMTMLLAGHKTTAVALTYTWYLLSKNPEQEARLHEELDEVLGGDPPEFDDLSDLTYTEKVVKESMRVYPPFHAVLREPVRDVEIGGYEIPEGALVATPQWVVHRDDRWFDDPEAFRPERWTEAFESDLPDFAYFPFGGGPRRCLGSSFATTEGQLVLATIAQDYVLDVEDVPLDLSASIATQPKNDIEMVPRER